MCPETASRRYRSAPAQRSRRRRSRTAASALTPHLGGPRARRALRGRCCQSRAAPGTLVACRLGMRLPSAARNRGATTAKRTPRYGIAILAVSWRAARSRRGGRRPMLPHVVQIRAWWDDAAGSGAERRRAVWRRLRRPRCGVRRSETAPRDLVVAIGRSVTPCALERRRAVWGRLGRSGSGLRRSDAGPRGFRAAVGGADRRALRSGRGRFGARGLV